MFLPNTTADLYYGGAKNFYSERAFATVPKKIEIGIVHLNKMAKPTSVRTDSSASRGAATEFVSQSKILVSADTPVVVGDKVIIGAASLVVTGIEERYDVDGKLDHYEVTLENWSA